MVGGAHPTNVLENMNLGGKPMSSPPEGYHTVTPYLVVQDIEALITFLKETFDAEETERVPGPDGISRHAEVRIGDSAVMMGTARGKPPVPGMLYVYTVDVDKVYSRALKAGGESIAQPENQFYGDRTAGVTDSQGNIWYMATRVENLSEEELRERALAKKG